jgi:predicted GTPase
MSFGAGVLAARTYGAAEIVDPRADAVGEIARTFEAYPDIGPLLPAMGYGEQQISDLQATINAVECDLVLIATPIDLAALIDIDKPHMRIGYRLAAEDGQLARAVESVLGS